MEKVKIIVQIVLFVIMAIAYIITTVLAFKRKKANGEKISADEALATIAEKVIGFVKDAESAFASVNKGGTLKLKDVLNDTKDLCESAGLIFDKSYWTEFIGKAVELINIERKTVESNSESSDTTVAK